LHWLAEFEARYSRFLPDSLICRINDSAGVAPVPIDEETDGLFRLCDWFFWSTAGAFDPTMLPLIRLWDYNVKHDHAPEDSEIRAARALIGWDRVVRGRGTVYLPAHGMGIDLGGIGKEYAVDRVLEMGRDWGFRDLIVDFGHDLRVSGEPPEKGAWRIGLEDPFDPGRCWAGVALRDRAVCSSGDYLRKFELNGRRYGHILDPRTGYPVDNGCRSATAIAPTCTAAGILATTAFILGAEKGLELLNTTYQAEGCICTEQGTFQSRRFDAYLT
jgi:thiamine biosynthesis lipoprotein